MNSKNPFKNIEGHLLHGISVEKYTEKTLRLELYEGRDYYVTTWGGCCSESWWADITGVLSATPGVVLKTEVLKDWFPDDDGRSRQEEDIAYGYQIKTNKGVIDLVFRNSSNGYYGGWAEQDTPEAYHDIEFEGVSSNDWRA